MKIQYKIEVLRKNNIDINKLFEEAVNKKNEELKGKNDRKENMKLEHLISENDINNKYCKTYTNDKNPLLPQPTINSEAATKSNNFFIKTYLAFIFSQMSKIKKSGVTAQLVLLISFILWLRNQEEYHLQSMYRFLEIVQVYVQPQNLRFQTNHYDL